MSAAAYVAPIKVPTPPSMPAPVLPEMKVEIRSISQQAPSENTKSVFDKIGKMFSFLAMK